MSFDRWVAGSLIPLVIWVLISGLDDLVLDLAFLYSWIREKYWGGGVILPSEDDLDSAPRGRIAVFVPLWHEHQVIERMLEHNIAANKYDCYDFFVGAYPNDSLTAAAVRSAEARFPNVHLAVCPHDGPTSKADCLNWIFQRMLLFEEEHDAYFDIVVTHDAEDLIHPDSFRFINYYAQWYGMVQIPVLPLPTPFREFTHGVYCDELGESQTRDLATRNFLGGFVPSTGVGTGFSRETLEAIAGKYSNRIFEPESLTEDYENGFRVHLLGLPQRFVPISKTGSGIVATREYFPRTVRAAIRQRTRWIMGIALQSWERHGWRESRGQLYWFWRDRKGLVGSPVSILCNLTFFYGCVTAALSVATGEPWALAQLISQTWLRWGSAFTFALYGVHAAVRMFSVSRIYGWRFALGVPLRMFWGNAINFLATACAITRFFSARLRGLPLVWLKTEHAYPSRAALMSHKRRLGDILTGSLYVSAEDVEAAMSTKPPDIRIGEHLLAVGLLTERELYEALSLQQCLPLEPLDVGTIPPSLARAIPAGVSRRWRILPFKVSQGCLHVAGPELPSDEMTRDLRRFSNLEIRVQLVTPGEFEKLAAQFLPVSRRALPLGNHARTGAPHN